MITKENPSMNTTAESIYYSNSDYVIRERCRAREDAIIHEKYQAERIEALSAENSTLTAENSTLTAENSTLAAENSTLTAENSTLIAENSTLTAENSILSNENTRLRKLLEENGIKAE